MPNIKHGFTKTANVSPNLTVSHLASVNRNAQPHTRLISVHLNRFNNLPEFLSFFVLCLHKADVTSVVHLS